MFRIFKFIRSKALIFGLISVIFTIGGCTCDLRQPILLQEVMGALYPIKQWDKFWTDIYWMIGLACISLACAVVAMLSAAKSSLLSTQYLRSGLYKTILGFSFSNVDKFSTGSLITRLTNDAAKYQMLNQMCFTVIIRSPVIFVGSMITSFTDLKPYLGVIAIGVSLIMILIIYLMCRNVFHIFDNAQKSLDETNSIMRENILGMRVVKSFGIQEEQTKRFRKASQSYKNFKIKGQTLIIPVMSVVMSCLQVGIVLALVAGGVEINAGNIEMFNEIFPFTRLLMMMLASVVMALAVVVQVVTSKASIYRILNVLDTKSTITNPANPISLPNNLDIKFTNVGFKYDQHAKQDVIKNINFEVKQGEFLGIIGGTGSGKSTLVNLIPRLYDINRGSVKLGGIDIKNISLHDLRKNIGVVLQENNLFQGDIRQNLLYGDQNASDEQLIQACKDACAWDFVKNFKGQLNYEVDQRGRNFSGGQKQRLCIARALVRKPKILILDDSTSALDLITEARVQDNIRKNCHGSTTIVVSQRVASIKNANKIIVMDKGSIVGLGNHKNLVKTCATYRSIVLSQLGKEGLR